MSNQDKDSGPLQRPSAQDYADINAQAGPHVSFQEHMMNNPFPVIGSLGGIGVLAYMIRGFRHREKNMPISMYLIHTRLGVQLTVVGVLTLGMTGHLWTDKISPWLEHRRQSEAAAADSKK
ncbi:hypothetical protein TCAL_05102 [Tigriopus californicus]|uniref:HIG1 domain-containing protein n=1 Tax=Tigriopus californicus TaxID=6832 RepID=A0A553NVP3_TIGCA|nr:uncharacterized protein LOC131890019 [Tigriopus californicus]XP_059095277.1 uncharacterized protein LOC131890019 [Tigriopus californicus]XP_059095285.1 uncharacterized protein LOC131890019 [Tigriopus californicus]XP_059095291.1 uncharacterized protein LOC131890019 [Tigriopus californicus]TRY69503.1 hypothetical protein TCAL_05102 [Tigriopus californicus]